MKRHVQLVRVLLLVLTAAAIVWSGGVAQAGAPVTMRDFTAPKDAAYEKWASESATRKVVEPKGAVAAGRRVCRVEACPVRTKAPATVEAPTEKPAPFLGGFKLLPR